MPTNLGGGRRPPLKRDSVFFQFQLTHSKLCVVPRPSSSYIIEKYGLDALKNQQLLNHSAELAEILGIPMNKDCAYVENTNKARRGAARLSRAFFHFFRVTKKSLFRE